LRIRHFNYFPDGPYNDALIIEKVDDDPTVEGGMIFGFSTSKKPDTSEGQDGWAVNFIPAMTIRQGLDGIVKIGIGTDNPNSKLTVASGTLTFAQIGADGRNYFEDSERAGRVRIGGVYGVPGIFSQEATKDLYIGVNPLRKIFFGSSAASSADAWIEGSTGNAYFKGSVRLGDIVNVYPDRSDASKRYVGFFGSEGLRIRHFNYFPDGPYNDALIIEKVDDDPTVEGGMIFGFSTSKKLDTSEGQDGWAVNFIPAMTIRQGLDGIVKIGIGTDNPGWALETKGMINASFDGISTKVINGPVSDSSFIGKPHDGLLAIDSKNGRLYFKANNSWSYIAKTGGFQIPKEEARDFKIDDLVIGKIDSEMSDGAKHGLWVKLTDALSDVLGKSLVKFKEIFSQKVITDEICSLDGRCVKVNDILLRSGANINYSSLSKESSENNNKLESDNSSSNLDNLRENNSNSSSTKEGLLEKNNSNSESNNIENNNRGNSDENKILNNQ